MNFMDMTMMATSPMTPAAGSNLMGQQLQIPGQAETLGPAFPDLLDLVADLDVAGQQEAGNELFLGEQLKEMSQEDLRSLEVEALKSKALLELVQVPMSAQIIGQEVPAPSAGIPGMKPADSLQMQGLEQGLKVQAHLQDLAATEPALDPEAVAMWTTALKSGEMKSVQLEAPEQAPPTMNAVALAPADLWTPEVNAQAVAKAASPGTSAAPKPAAADYAVSAIGAKPVGKVEAKEASAAAAPAVPAFTAWAPAAVDKVTSSDRVVKDIAVRKEGKSVEEKPAQNAADFLLDRPNEASIPSRLRTELAAPALKSVESLDKPGDQRIPGHALDFVADKVSALQQQGGGTVRVNMDTPDVGALQIRVGKKLGQVAVEIKAERPATLELLRASQPELMQRLDAKVGSSQVEFSAGHSTEILGRDASTVALASRTRDVGTLMGSSEALMELKTGSTREVAAAGKSADTTTAGDPSDGWQRDERREKARAQWEESAFQQRSA